jgi:DNA polymerase III epsilon subunit-like protein
MREIVFDTETTGLDPLQGDRLVEIGCIEMVNRYPTGKTFHFYFNPERDMPEQAFRIHGLSLDFLKDKPLSPMKAISSSATLNLSPTTRCSTSGFSMPSWNAPDAAA